MGIECSLSHSCEDEMSVDMMAIIAMICGISVILILASGPR